MAAKKKSAKKTVGRKAVTKTAKKKAATKKTATTKPGKQPASLRIAKVTPSRDGAQWTLQLSDGAKVKVPMGAAQTVGLGVGSAWSGAVHARIEQAVAEQALFTRAMDALAGGGKHTPASLVKLLGGDAAARSTVAALRKTGWIG